MIYAVCITAALCLGLGFVLQQHAAQSAPPADFLRFRLLLDLVRKPIWVGGIAAMIAGQLLSGAALAKADVSLVEPLLTANLLFALVIARLIYRQPLGVQEWAGALLLSGGVTAFILAGQPAGGDPEGDSLNRWALAIGIGSLSYVCVWAARKQRAAPGLHSPPRAMLLATGAGLLYGIQDGLTRRTTRDFHGHVLTFLTHWSPYALLGIGVVGILLAQSAFEAGPLRSSLPALTAAEPLSGIAVGVVVFQEHVRFGPGALAAEACGLAAMCAGVLLVARSGTFGHLDVRRVVAHAVYVAGHHRHATPMHVGHAAEPLRAAAAASPVATVSPRTARARRRLQGWARLPERLRPADHRGPAPPG